MNWMNFGYRMNRLSQISNKPFFLAISFIALFCFSHFAQANVNPPTSELKKLAVTKQDTHSQYMLGYRYEMGKTVKRSHQKAINWYKKAAKKNHRDAQYRIGLLYYKQKKYEKARYWLAKRAKDGHADAQYLFANTFRYALGTKEQTSTARKWFTKAANQGHAKAQFELGLQYQNGIGARKSQNTANKWFKLAAKQGDKKAKKILANNKPEKSKIKKQTAKQFVREKLRLARNGNTKAQYALGKAYLEGKNTKVDIKKSYYWLKKAANKNHTKAQYELGSMYFEGNSAAKKDTSKAKVWFGKAADKNHIKAKEKLKTLNVIAKKIEKEDQFNGIIDEAMLGGIEQQYELGMRYLLGYQTSIDNQQAIYWLNKAAKQNHALAQYQLANQYMAGNFVNQSTTRSIHFFTVAAKQNIQAAKFALKHFAENGYGDLVNAENGDKEAQYQLAIHYLNEEKITKQKKGLEWLRLAADQSHPAALLKIGNLYTSGVILEKNQTKAFEAYAKAAELDNADAQFQLSQMYKKGLGTTQNQLLAARWLSRAANQGHPEAQKSLQFTGI